MSTTVRVTDQTHEKLRALAEASGESIQGLIDRIVEEYRVRRFWEETNAAFAALRADSVAWAEEIEERALWENTLMDGLEDDE